MKRLTCLLLALCLLAAMAACGEPYIDPGPQQTQPTQPTTPPRGDGPSPLPETTLSGLRAATSYAEVYGELQANRYSDYLDGGIIVDEMEAVDDAAPMEPEAPAPDSPSNSTTAEGDYSGTNVQVSGIDEGDIVKTDGKYIYVLRGHELVIFKADGAETKEVWRKTVGVSEYEKQDDTIMYGGNRREVASSTEKRPIELYVSGNRLAVIYSYYSWCEYYQLDTEYNREWGYESESRVEVELLDISDPAQPHVLTSFAQDGSYNSSRMTDGTLYLLTNYWVEGQAEENEPDSFVPALYCDGEASLLPADCIWLPEHHGGNGCTVVTAHAIESGAEQAALSVLGGGNTVYMSHDDLYLARQHSEETVSAPRTEDVYTVTDYSYKTTTELLRISLVDGGLTMAASGSVDGYLINQFALDAHDGCLRLVTTSSGHSYTIWEDEKRGFVNHTWPEVAQRDTNNLFVLDSDLNVVGSITGLAEDERVYSVRFDGNIGYFVTFRQTDPLFAVDLSDPTAPTLLSALKIPGFSQYMHVYGEGRLFGLGMDADEETGWTETMKLSMFDTSDPANVTEKHTLVLEQYWSEALHNHKAILISPEKDVIAFPTDRGYVIYGYSDAQGFYLRAELKDTDNVWWYGNARGLYIGQYAYVVGETQLWVMDLEQLMLTQTVAF